MIQAIEIEVEAPYAGDISLDTTIQTSIYFHNCEPFHEMYYMVVYRTDTIKNIKAQFIAFQHDEINYRNLGFFYGPDHVEEGQVDWDAEMDDNNNIYDYAPENQKSGHTIYFCEREEQARRRSY